MTLPFENRPQQISRLAWIALLFILIVAAAARFINIGGPVYELDEYWHAELSTGRGSVQNHLPHDVVFMPGSRITSLKDAPPFWKIWTHMEFTVHPPMYPIALRFWRATFGEGAAASRSLGAVASLISILILFDIIRRTNGTTAALWSAAIFAVASPQITLSRTLRGYTFGAMLVLAVAWIVVRAIENPKRFNLKWMIALTVLTAGAMLTHYFTVFPLAAIGIFALVRAKDSLRWKLASAMTSGAVIFAVTWTPWLLEQRKTLPAATDSWIYDGGVGHVSRTLMFAASLPARMLFEPRKDAAVFAICAASLYIIPIFLIRRRPNLLLWTLWLWFVMLPLLALDLSRGTKHLSFTRYTLLAGPPIFALLATLLQHARLVSMRHLIPAVTVIACVMSIGSAYEEPRVKYNEMAEFIDARYTSGEAIIIHANPKSWYSNAVFLTLSGESKSYPWPLLLTDDFPIDEKILAQLRAKSNTVWIIAQGEKPDPADMIRGAKVLEWMYVPFAGMVWHVAMPD